MLFICLENLATSPNYPILFGYFGDLAKFSRILHEHKILSEHSHLILHLAMFKSVLWSKQKANRCQIVSCYVHEVSEKIWLCVEKNGVTQVSEKENQTP